MTRLIPAALRGRSHWPNFPGRGIHTELNACPNHAVLGPASDQGRAQHTFHFIFSFRKFFRLWRERLARNKKDADAPFLMMADQGRGCVCSNEETRAPIEVWAEESVQKLGGSVRN